MAMYNKKDEFLAIEKSFSSIKSGVAVKENLRKIEIQLNKVFDMQFHLEVVENQTNEFFGMNVYPAVNTMDALVESIIAKDSKIRDSEIIWKNNNEWYIEIDSLLISNMSINANPQEMTAVLLHEIGHIVYSNTIPRKIYKILRLKIIKLNYQMRALVSHEKIRKLFNISIIESCSSKNFRSSSVSKETDADKFVIRYGYGEDLDNFIGKLIRIVGNDKVNQSEEASDKDIQSTVNWAVLNVKELEFRKKKLKTSLKVEILKTPSLFTKRVIQDIYNSFFGESTDKYRELLSEQYNPEPVDVYSSLLAEQSLMNDVKRILESAGSNMFDKYGKLKKITQADIDILIVESERIDSVDDKIYLLDKLYSYLELVNSGLDYINSGEKAMTSKVQQSKSTLMSMKRELEDLRGQILATRIIDKEYGVFVRAPKGYEG